MDNTSLLNVNERTTVCEPMNPGTVLTYFPGRLITSPNGVCRKKNHGCCRGIHAYKTIDNRIFKIIKVYAMKWHGRGNEVRARKVYVE